MMLQINQFLLIFYNKKDALPTVKQFPQWTAKSTSLKIMIANGFTQPAYGTSPETLVIQTQRSQ